MANYMDTLDYYEAPLLDIDGYAADTDDYRLDPVRQIQIRMVVVFALALMVASALALLALPHSPKAASPIAMSVGGPLESEQTAADTLPVPVDTSLSTSMAAGAISPLFTSEVQYWAEDIVKWANENDLDPNAVATIMQIESCGNPQAVSIAGARGLFQVMPFHFTSGEDMLDPDTNARRGLNFLNEQLRYTGGDIFLSFAGYNGGFAASGGSYDNWPDETKRYYQWAKGIYEDARSGATTSATLDAWLDAGGRPGCEIAAGSLGI